MIGPDVALESTVSWYPSDDRIKLRFSVTRAANTLAKSVKTMIGRMNAVVFAMKTLAASAEKTDHWLESFSGVRNLDSDRLFPGILSHQSYRWWCCWTDAG